MADNKLTGNETHVVLVTTMAEHCDLQNAKFLKVSRFFAFNVRKQL